MICQLFLLSIIQLLSAVVKMTMTSTVVSLIHCYLFYLLWKKSREGKKVKGKGKFLYSAVSSPQDRSKRFTLYFPDRPVHSDTTSTSLGNIQPYATINMRRLLVHISITVYSQVLIYTAE